MKQILKRIFHHEELTREEACTLMQRMTGGEMNEAQTAALLAAFQMRGVKVMTNRYETIYRPSELGFSMARQEELYGGNTPEEAASIFDRVLHNEGSKAQTDCVLINASFAIQALEPQKKIEECVALATESLESGKALATLHKFLTLNQ